MSIRILWRSTIFLLTLALIYLAFPVLIVPSSLPAIKAIFIDNELPRPTAPVSTDIAQTETDAHIFELNVPVEPTLKTKLNAVLDLHRQGMDLILNRASPESR